MSHSKKDRVLMLVDECYIANTCSVCVVCIHGKENLFMLENQLRQIEVDPVVKAYRKNNIFHYNEDSIGARQSLSSWIYKMPISAYIVLEEKEGLSTKEDKNNFAYQTLLPEILKPLKMKFFKRYSDNLDYLIKFENLTDRPNLDKTFFSKILENIPLCGDMGIEVVTKDKEPLILLPDYFLGFVNHCMQGQVWSADTLKLIGNKIGLILTKGKDKNRRYERGNDIVNFLSQK